MSKIKPNCKKQIFEMCIFAMLGSLMFCSKIIMEIFPNIHLLGMFVMVSAVVFGVRGLIPVYIYVFMNGVYAGFNIWWIPYLYIWTILWGITMLLPKKMSPKACAVVYPLVCALHGLFFGLLYSPAEAILFGLNFKQTIAWVIAGIPYDLLHMAGNFVAGILVLPLSKSLTKILKSIT